MILPTLWHSQHISLDLLIPTLPEEAEKMLPREFGNVKGNTRLNDVVRLITRLGTDSVSVENQDS